MKDILLVYYSLEGNTQFAAETAAGCASMDVERLVPLKEPPKKGFGKFFWGGKSVVMNERPELEALKFSPDSYGTIIFAFPVWASSYPPAIATYLRDCKLTGKDVYVIACSAGGNAAFEKLAKQLEGCTVKDTLSLTDPAKDKDKNSALIKEFIDKNITLE